MAHMHLTGAASQIDIAASLSAATTSSVVPASGSWSGTAAWIDSAQQMPGNRGGAGQMPGAVNQTLTLNLNNGVLAGTGYGCTFTGTLPGTVNAAGCTDATFNGSYEQVSLVLTGNVLTVNFGKGALDSGMMGTGMSVRIVGSLAASQ
jgi:hypothetical protein